MYQEEEHPHFSSSPTTCAIKDVRFQSLLLEETE